MMLKKLDKKMMNAETLVRALLADVRANEPMYHGKRKELLLSMVTLEEFKVMVHTTYIDVQKSLRETGYEEAFPPLVVSYVIPRGAVSISEEGGQQFIFAMYHGDVGKPFFPLSFIEVAYWDVVVFNLCKKDLIMEHLAFVLKHELAHYFGWKHGESGVKQ